MSRQLGFKLKLFTLLFLIILAAQGTFDRVAAQIQRTPFIYGRVVDANNGSAIPAATVLIWDLFTLEKPKLGAGIYFTNSDGEYNVTGPYVVAGHWYQIYAYRGNLTTMEFDYVPQSSKVFIDVGELTQNVSFQLVPSASIYLTGEILVVESSSPSYRFLVEAVNPLTGSPHILNGSYVSEYGDSVDAWFLELDRKLVIIPAGVPVSLIINAWFFEREKGVFKVTFVTEAFTLNEGAKKTHTITEYGLKRSIETVNGYITSVSLEVNEAQRVGFYVAEERRSLLKAQSDVYKARGYLDSKDYWDCWDALRKVYKTMQGVLLTLAQMRLISTASAVYLPAFFAVYSVILAFFVFEKDKKKLISSLLFYGAFITILFLMYPGTRLIVSQNLNLFLEIGALSIAVTLVLIFGLPRVWTELEIKGKVTLKSTASTMFSMAKRQIRRRRLRGFLTITSVVILVLAFTSLTSFGTVYGIASEAVEATPPADGVLVRRPGTEEAGIKIPFSPLSLEDLPTLSRLLDIEYTSPKMENMPDVDPIAQLVTDQGKNISFYGIIGVASLNETRFTHLNEIVTTGQYLNGSEDEILISERAAVKLGVNVNESVRFYVRGIPAPLTNFTLKGFFDDDDEFGQVVDLDGRSFWPMRIIISDETQKTATCNSTDVIIMDWQAAVKLQRKANVLSTGAPQFAVLSRVDFLPLTMDNLDELIRTLTLTFEYDVYISKDGRITHHFLGYYYEAKGTTEILIPLVMVGLNIGAVMLNAVYERRREMHVLSVVGLNPANLAFVFIAEAIVLGMVGGGLGYLFGLGFYRIMALMGQSLMVREKLEWWWSAIAFGLALMASILSTIRPALTAVKMYTPSMIRKIKLAEKEREAREKEVYKAFQATRITMPVKVHKDEAPFFFGYVTNRFKDLETGTIERFEEIKELPYVETPKGEHIKEITFNHFTVDAGRRVGTKNRLISVKGPGEDSYRVELICAPIEPGIPAQWIDRTVDIVRDITMEWIKNKKRIMGI